MKLGLNHFLVVTAQSWVRGGGQVVSVLAFYSDHPSSKPYRFFLEKMRLKRMIMIIIEERMGLTHFFVKERITLSH